MNTVTIKVPYGKRSNADRPPLRWRRGNYNCIVSGEYTICRFPITESVSHYFAFFGVTPIGEFQSQENADAAKALCAEHARARE